LLCEATTALMIVDLICGRDEIGHFGSGAPERGERHSIRAMAGGSLAPFGTPQG
jgi:hypothetical protein